MIPYMSMGNCHIRFPLEMMFAGFPICADAIAFVLECEDQRVAARVLGFDFYLWFSSKAPQPASTEKTWIEMTDEEKATLLILGYSAHGWDTRSPSSDNLYWRDLTDGQRTAAEMLGYKPAKWNDRKVSTFADHVLVLYYQHTLFINFYYPHTFGVDFMCLVRNDDPLHAILILHTNGG